MISLQMEFRSIAIGYSYICLIIRILLIPGFALGTQAAHRKMPTFFGGGTQSCGSFRSTEPYFLRFRKGSS